MIVLFTVGLSIPLKEVPGSNLLLAVGADEMLWVPRLPHGGHNLQTEVECGSGPWPATEQQRSYPPATPPRPTSTSHHLPSNGLLAGPADTLGNCGNTQFVQVRLQAPQHAI